MRWRPIKTAPKDEHILLRYESFAGDGEMKVNQGHWVQYPHENVVMSALDRGDETFPAYPAKGHWEIAYVAILNHGGRWDGYSYESRGCEVEPTHWMPLPKA